MHVSTARVAGPGFVLGSAPEISWNQFSWNQMQCHQRQLFFSCHSQTTQTRNGGLTPQWRHNPWEGQVRGTVSVKFLPWVFTENSQWKQAFSISKHMKVLVAVINHVWRTYLLLPGRACPPRVLLASGDLQKLPWGEVQRGTEFRKTLLLQSRKNVIKSCCCESGLKYYLNHTLYLKIYDFKYDFMIRNVSIYKL